MTNDEQMPELLPCPFCGADEIEDWGDATWSQGETAADQLSRFCDALEADFKAKQDEART